jgi:hypothetical protein
MGIKDPRTRRHLRLQIERKTEEFSRKALGLGFLERENETSSGLLKIRNWTLWRGRPPPKRKKYKQTAHRGGVGNVEVIIRVPLRTNVRKEGTVVVVGTV